jgi:hypothetical protein
MARLDRALYRKILRLTRKERLTMTAFAIITARMKSMNTTLMSITTEPPINLSRSSTLETGLCANRDSIRRLILALSAWTSLTTIQSRRIYCCAGWSDTAAIMAVLDRPREAQRWSHQAAQRAEKINRLTWNDR